MNQLLSFAGRHGPAILFLGVLLGLADPALADAAKPLMGLAVFVFTLGAFLKVDGASFRAELARPARLIAQLFWIVAGVPLATWALLQCLPLPQGVRTGALLCMLGPPVGSAAAMAAMLRLNPALALVVTVLASVASSLILPPAALALGDVRLQLDAAALMMRMAVVVGGAALVAAALRRFAGAAVRANPNAMTGISVLGLIVVAIGAMHGMQPQLARHLNDVGFALVVAFALNAGFQLLGAALFARQGASDALTVGLMSGNRNVTLVWVAVLPWLSGMPGVELYLAASVFPIFMLPLPLARLLAFLRGRNPVTGGAPGAVALSCADERGHGAVARSPARQGGGDRRAVRARLPGAEANRPTETKA
jgi:predicted Na+-dependent transporter